MTSADFELHPALARDSTLIARIGAIQIRLQNHAPVPWVVLVPETNARELIELDPSVRQELQNQQDRVSGLLLDAFSADKLNIAAIGNKVPQLHLHVIGRFEGDAHWPDVVWGEPSTPYPDIHSEIARWQALLAGAND